MSIIISCYGEENGADVPVASSAPINPEYLEYLEKVNSLTDVGDYALGYEPPVISFDHLIGKRPYDANVQDLYPSSYDLRTLDKLTPIKNQNPWGTCWAFGSLASLESSLKPNQTYDFSEKNVVNRNLWLTGPDTGGNFIKSGGYLVAWMGPVNETTDPYPVGTWNFTSPSGPVTKHVREIYWIAGMANATDLDTIKGSIVNNGALISSFNWTNTSYDETHASYYCPTCTGSNHCINLVGWDDNYSRNNFTTPAPGDGAFLLRNSWGTSWGDQGYGWISYHDPTIGKTNAHIFGSDVNDYSGIYQYDPAGTSSSIGIPSTSIWGGNIFTATADENLTAVGFYTNDVSASYDVRVYKNPTAGGPVGSTILSQKTGTIPMSGYHTISLDTPVFLSVGDIFSIVVHLTNPSYGYPLAVENPASGPIGNTWSANPGEGYVSSDGNSWTDIVIIPAFVNTSICIKGYTNTVTPPPVANFTSNLTNGPVPLTIQFTDTSTGSPSSWLWNFGEGNTSSSQNPVHTYTAAGLYTVNLTASNAGGSDTRVALDYINVTTPVPLPPVASFTSNVTSGDIPLCVQFTDTSTGNPTSWSWSFGEGLPSILQNPVHEYTASGLYTVNLSVSNAGGSNLTSVPNYINATMPIEPVARFTSNVTTGPVPLCVQYTDQSTGNPNSWYWTFGDGTNTTTRNPIHTYGMPGVYTVNLSVANSAGTNLTSKAGYINATSPLPNPVVTGIYPNFTKAGMNVGFNLTGNYFSEGSIVNLTQSGYSNITTFGSISGSNLTGIFNLSSDTATGMWNVTVNRFGQYSNDNVQFQVLPPVPPVASFIGIPRTGVAPLLVQFADTSTGSPTSWTWNFGDGNLSAYQHPNHTYSGAGLYTVSLNVSNNGGFNLTTAPGYINVTSSVVPPVASFTGTPRNGIAPLSVQFTDTSSGGPTAWNWAFGDGNLSTQQNPFHTYSGVGLYTVSLNVSNSAGSNLTNAPGYINVTSSVVPPVASFTGTPRGGLAPLSVQFTDTSSGGPTNWTWTFGDSNFSSQQNPVHSYSGVGLYTVSLNVSNSAGSSLTTTPGYINVTSSVFPPSADFTASPTSGTIPLTVYFNDTSTGNPTTWEWYFGDYTPISTSQNPVHVYSIAGLYDVTLMVSNSAGTSIINQTGYINATSPIIVLPLASFTGTPRSGVSPLSVQFTDTSSGGPTSWAWNFGDSNFSSQQNPVHTYSGAGLYTVSLNVSNSAGSNQMTSPGYINVTSSVVPPVASFTGTPRSGVSPLSVQFTDTSSGGPTAWNWNFGDGLSSTMQHPIHTYAGPGQFTVNLTVSNTAGTDTLTVPDYISVSAPPSHYSINASSGSNGRIDPSGLIIIPAGGNQRFSMISDTGYQVGDVLVDQQSVGPVGLYEFRNINSNHTISVNFERIPGQKLVNASANRWSIVYPPGVSAYQEGTNNSYITQAKPGAEMKQILIDSVEQNLSEFWTFTNISEDHSIYTYSEPIPDQIHVFFRGTPSTGSAPLGVQFIDESIGGPTSWLWQFGDGGRSYQQNPYHEYQTPGIYTVTLRAYNGKTGGYGVWSDGITVKF